MSLVRTTNIGNSPLTVNITDDPGNSFGRGLLTTGFIGAPAAGASQVIFPILFPAATTQQFVGFTFSYAAAVGGANRFIRLSYQNTTDLTPFVTFDTGTLQPPGTTYSYSFGQNLENSVQTIGVDNYVTARIPTGFDLAAGLGQLIVDISSVGGLDQLSAIRYGVLIWGI